MELTKEIASEHNMAVDEEGFHEEFKKHQELSRTVSAGMFKGGLADAGDKAAKLHTATHLLLAALRKVLGEDVQQKGSNITGERLRLDFSHDKKMTPEEIAKVEKLVNEAIEKNIPVKCAEMTLEDAQKTGAIGVFGDKYGEKVKVYSIYDFSTEICGGPHAARRASLENLKSQKKKPPAPECGESRRFWNKIKKQYTKKSRLSFLSALSAFLLEKGRGIFK